MAETNKTIYDLKLHETINVSKGEDRGSIEVTRVPGGWVYAFEYPGFRQSPVVFIPYGGDKDDPDYIKTLMK